MAQLWVACAAAALFLTGGQVKMSTEWTKTCEVWPWNDRGANRRSQVHQGLGVPFSGEKLRTSSATTRCYWRPRRPRAA